MCGILGLATLASGRIGMPDDAVARLRDLMTHRGPDGAGLWRSPNVVFAHRRLAVVDPSPAGAQPFVSVDGRYALVYNGELYNDAELRRELSAPPHGVSFRTTCDTETVMAALACWGVEGLTRLRGMFALGFYDTLEKRLLLARDALGIKPLYFWIAEGSEPLVLFASEPTPILAHPDVPVRPDLISVSAYLTTIRTVLSNRTMFEGVRTLRPGEALDIDLSGAELQLSLFRHWRGAPSGSFAGSFDLAVDRVRETLHASVAAHMRSDVPTCALLSGGLDSSAIVSAVAAGRASNQWSHRTYCSGAKSAENSDFEFARIVAQRFNTVHTEAPITRELFGERWRSMVARQGVPLSTPNEIAINEVSRRLRADGQVVALSGEGADELFAGYDAPMTEAALYEANRKVDSGGGGEHQLNANAWMPLETKPVILNEAVWRAVEQDAELRGFYADEFATVEEECGSARSPIDAHLRFHRRINLAGLLQRLDTATMLESVEGRTPFADREVAALAESLPMSMKFTPGVGATPAGTKLALRRAFAEVLPPEVVERPKASFPLPFQEWVADHGAVLRSSPLAREIFAPAVLEMVAADPSRHWRVAWPMINLALWGERWWRG